MPAKPAARRASSLAGQHVADASPAQPASPATTTAAAAPVTTARTGTTTKFSVTVDTEVLDEAKNAFWAAMAVGRYRTFGDFVNEAIADKTSALAKKLNGGADFPPRPSDNLPPGRRI